MKKKIIILLILTSTCYSQETLIPEKTVSFGLNGHTNRDESFFSNVDNDKNTILIGTTERDSTFTDILTTKLDINYNLLWQKRYSTPTNLSYDLPLKSFVNDNDDIYVIGRSSFSQSRANGLIFIIKYDKYGNIIYEKKIGNIDGSDYSDYTQMDVILNNDDTLSLFYELDYYHTDDSGNHNGDITSTFYLLKIGELGNILNSINHEIPYEDFKAQFYNDNLYILMKNSVDENNQDYSYRLYEMNNNGTLSYFNILDDTFIDFMKYGVLQTNVNISFLSNSVYISSFNNNNYSQIKDKIYFSKFSLSGANIYSVVSDQNKKYFYLGSFKKTDQEKVFNLVNNLETNTLSSIVIDESNQVVENEIFDTLGTGFKDNNDESFFLTISNNIIKLFSKDLTVINSFNTSNTYNLIDFTKIDNSTISSYGIKLDKMFPDSDYYAQIDQFSEKINEDGIEKTYLFSGKGTSKSFQQTIHIDNDNNYIILSNEKLGPECLYNGCNKPPTANRVLKYDSNLNKLWELDFGSDVLNITSSYNSDGIVIDSNNNIYLNIADRDHVWWDPKYSLYKISPDGSLIYTKQSLESKEIVLDESNHTIYVISPEFQETNQTTWVTSYWTELTSFNLNSGELIKNTKYDNKKHFSHFLNNGFLNLYMINHDTFNDYRLSLFVEDQEVFERILDIYGTGDISHFEPIIKENNGTLIFTSGHSSNSEDRKIHKINNLNDYNTYSLNHNLRKITLINNKMLASDDEGYLKIYNENFQEVETSNISYSNCCGFYFTVFNNKILLQYENKITFFDENLNMVNEIILPYLFDKNFKFDYNNDLILVNNFGKSIYQFPEYSWLRGKLSKYDLDAVLSINKNEGSNLTKNVKIFPNPSKDILTINLDDIKKIHLYSLEGKLLNVFYSNKINIKKYSKGLYLLKIYTESNAVINRKILKN